MGEQRARAACQDGGQVAPLLAQSHVANRVDPLMQLVQPTGRKPVIDRPPPNPKVEQLPASDRPALRTSQLPHRHPTWDL